MPLNKQTKTCECINGCGPMNEDIRDPEIKSWAMLPVTKNNRLDLGSWAYTATLFECSQCGYVEMYSQAFKKQTE